MQKQNSKTIFENGIEYSLGILESLRGLINDSNETIKDNNFNLTTYIKTEIEREKQLLGLFNKDILINEDPKRCFLGTVPYANYLFTTILNKNNNEINLEVSIFSDENPFRKKYENKALKTYEEKFECLRDYINENSFAKNAANIGGLAGATDFLQLYKYVMLEEIINKDDRIEILKSLFEVLNSKTIKEFTSKYEAFKNVLIGKNIDDDKRLTRLYNRLYYVFSFILNNLYPEIFPIYFGATRRGLKRLGIEGYENIQKFYIEFLENIEIFKIVKDEKNEYIVKNYDEIKVIIKEYNKLIAVINDENYIFKDNKNLNFYKDLFKNHANYKCFQDICWVISLEKEEL